MNFRNLYKLRWNKTDNPNGWIEPTTFCNLECPGCYRGCDQVNTHKPAHLPLNEVKQQIDWMIENRNIHTLSVAGGEPLLYPHLDELIVYASERNLRVMIYTNGILLKEKMLLKLIDLGVTQFLIHVDDYQKRKSGKGAQAIREQFCNLFRNTGCAGLGFIQPLSHKNLAEIDTLVDFYRLNRDIINLVVFTIYREIHWNHTKKPNIDTSLSIVETIDKLKSTNFIKPTSYLESTINKAEPSWVFSYSLGNSKNIYGFIQKHPYKRIQERYHKTHKRYLFISQTNHVKISGLLKLGFYPSIFEILLKRLISKELLYWQTCLIIRGPVKKNNQWDFCQGCPDAMLYKGELQPSCILEELKETL